MATIVGAKALLLPKLPDGSDNPLWNLLNYADLVGISPRIEGENALLGPISDFAVLGLAQVAGVIALGCEITGYPAWVLVEDMATEVPSYLDTREQPDDGSLEPLRWENYVNEYYPATIAGEKTYVPTNASGSHLAGSVLLKLINDGFEVKTLPQMREIVAANQPSDI